MGYGGPDQCSPEVIASTVPLSEAFSLSFISAAAQAAEADALWLMDATADARAARKDVIDAKFPALVAAFEYK